MNKFITAYTAPEATIPAFINISTANDDAVVTVRRTGSGAPVEVVIPKAEAAKLFAAAAAAFPLS